MSATKVNRQGLGLLKRKLLSHSPLTADDLAAIDAMPFQQRQLEAGSYLLREGDRSKICPILLSGFAFRHKTTASGGRQIVAVKMPGDALDFQSLYVEHIDHCLQALTRIDIAVVQNKDIERLFIGNPNIARAIVVDIVVEASIGREWLLNIGRRNGFTRLAHLLCEIHFRLSVAETSLLVDKLPLTQEQLADLLGLSPVHVNRCLKALERAGAIMRQGRSVRIGDLRTLRSIAEFTDYYLHFHDS